MKTVAVGDRRIVLFIGLVELFFSGMRVLHIIQCTNLGGMEHTALTAAKRFTARGHEWRFVSLNPVGALGPLVAEAGIPVQGLSYRGLGGWRSVPTMARVFRSTEADAVIMTGHNLAASIALGRLCMPRRLLGIHFHHSGVKPRWQWQVIYRAALEQFPAITFSSDFIRKEAEEICPPIAAISHTVRNPFPMPELPTSQQRADARRALDLPLDVPVIGNAGWLITRKRFDVFLRVAQGIAARFPEARFVIAGDGPLRTELRNLAETLRLSRQVLWLGWQPDLTPFYTALDVLLFNTDWDAMGRTPLEALSLGVPVVASVVNGGLCEVLDRSEYSLLIRSHDIDWLTDKVLHLLCTPSAARAFSIAGRARLAKIGDPESYCDAIGRLLRLDSPRVAVPSIS